MRKTIVRIFGLSSALLLLGTTAQAQGKGHGKGHDKDRDRHGHEQDDNDQDEHHGRSQVIGQTVNGQVVTVDPRRQGTVVTGDPRRQGTVIPNGDPRRSGTGVYDDGRYQDGRKVPPGLAKKPGGMPPGQYKKMYRASQGADVLGTVMRRRGYTVVRTQPYGSSQYVYYRMGNGGVQRAIVSPGTERLQFTNVPAALINEVLSRLY